MDDNKAAACTLHALRTQPVQCQRRHWGRLPSVPAGDNTR
jgi:hypothetical protein